VLDGRLERHATWKECEARVKGRPAKFKKVRSAEEEREVLKGWGLA
jgi:viroplasmin and RNaseH domain-containing protein